MMKFASREQAGQLLGRHLKDEGVEVGLVLGLPRGGVVVAAEVARELARPLDVLIVRKIGHPWHREFAVGALAEPDIFVLDETVVGRNPLLRYEIKGIIKEETERLRAYRARFHRDGLPQVKGVSVMLVDDGLATGATTEAAARSLRKQEAGYMVVATPVASVSAVGPLARVAARVHALWIDPDFDAVGRYYESFPQTTDDQVIAVLGANPDRAP